MALVAAFTVSVAAMAQDQAQEGKREFKKMDPTEMVKHRTDGMVKKYGLNEQQAKQLLELNTKFAGKMGPRAGMKRMGRPDGAARDSVRKMKPKGERQMKARREIPEEMKKQMEAYDTELKQILTEEQYSTYKEDMKKRPQRPQHPRHHGLKDKE